MATIRVEDPVFEASATTEESRLKNENVTQSIAAPKIGRMMSTRSAQWTATKMPATSVGKALAGLQGFERLGHGIAVLKVTTRGQLKKRVLTVSDDRFALFVTHALIKGKNKGFTMAKTLAVPLISTKGILGLSGSDGLRGEYVRHIDVADIDGVQLGFVGTLKLEAARGRVNRLKGESSTVDSMADQIVTILHHGNQSLDLLVPDKKDRIALETCVRQMRQTYMAAQKHVSNEDLLLRYIWYDVDSNQDGVIGKKEFAKILVRINLYVKDADKKYNDFVKELGAQAKPDGLTYPQVMTLLQKLKLTVLGFERKTVARQIWDETFGTEEDSITADVFLKKFLHKVQGMNHLTIHDAQEILMTVNHMEINHSGAHTIENIRPDKELTPARFDAYLFDAMNDCYDPWALRPGGALEHSMSQYWINTSHNTYLTGDQVQSISSVSKYMEALRRGCKCLELDVWDGLMSKDGKPQPVVFHGHTLTSKILFADILRGVKAYMISNPQTYPIILSLENHCSHPFQKVMAEDLSDILGAFLHVPLESERHNDLPSPEALKGRVVIKGKRPPEPDEDAKEGAGTDTVDESKSKTAPELAKLTLFHGVKFHDFDESIKEPPTHMHSIGETKIPKILSKQAANTKLWRQYNTHHMTRTYPAGKRVDSSNYNPITPWSVGCQMVALNFQTSDTPLVLNDGRFRSDRRSGYILKPKSILDDQVERKEDEEVITIPKELKMIRVPTAKEEQDALSFMMGDMEAVLCGERTQGLEQHELMTSQPAAKRSLVMERIRKYQKNTTNHVGSMQLRVRVMAGSCLPKPKGQKSGEHIDPYVTVTVHDVKEGGDGKATYVSSNFTTNTVSDNGFYAVWSDKSVKEFTVHNPEVAMIQFSVKESDLAMDEQIADAAIPCNRLRRGYRSVQLYDKNNSRTGPFGFARLLVQIEIV